MVNFFAKTDQMFRIGKCKTLVWDVTQYCTTVISFRFNHTMTVSELNKKPQIREFHEHHVEIRTCGNLYKEWKKRKLFRTVPDGDLQFAVPYVDTSKDHDSFSGVNDKAPIVLALHGAPGSYKDFSLLTSFLYAHGNRVIAPSFPDFSHYPPGIFRHSASERKQYIKDFLKAIDVPHLDLLVCHSSAVYPGLKLCVENIEPTISGLALFNPGAFDTSMRGIQPWPIIRSLAKVSEYSFGLKLYQMFGAFVLKLIRIPVRIEKIMDPLLSATVMTYGDITLSRTLYHQLALKKLPILLAFSEDDKTIDKDLSYKIAYTLDVQDPHVFHYDEKGVLNKEGKVVDNIKVAAFEKGSHYVFSKHSEIINEELLDFLKKHVL